VTEVLNGPNSERAEIIIIIITIMVSLHRAQQWSPSCGRRRRRRHRSVPRNRVKYSPTRIYDTTDIFKSRQLNKNLRVQ